MIRAAASMAAAYGLTHLRQVRAEDLSSLPKDLVR
jgi:hypothetical protein